MKGTFALLLVCALFDGCASRHDQRDSAVAPVTRAGGVLLQDRSIGMEFAVDNAASAYRLDLNVEAGGQKLDAVELWSDGRLVYSVSASGNRESYAPGWNNERAIRCSSYVFRKALWPNAPPAPGTPEDIAAWLEAHPQYKAKTPVPDMEDLGTLACKSYENSTAGPNTPTAPPRPPNVPPEYIYNGNGPRGPGWYKPFGDVNNVPTASPPPPGATYAVKDARGNIIGYSSDGKTMTPVGVNVAPTAPPVITHRYNPATGKIEPVEKQIEPPEKIPANFFETHQGFPPPPSGYHLDQPVYMGYHYSWDGKEYVRGKKVQ